MVNQSKKIIMIILAFVFLALGSPSLSNAATAPEGNFGVKAVLPENQIDKNLGYFDLLVTPKQEQTLDVVLSNTAENTRTFDVSVNPGVTSDGGTIDYGQTNVKLDKTVPFDTRKAVTVEHSEYQVPGKSDVTIPVKLQLPDTQFKGRVLAGVHVSPKDEEKTKQSTNGNSVSIKNKIGYNLAIVLQQSQDEVSPDLKMLDSKVAAINAAPTIQLHFQNPAATIISDLVFKSKVYLNDKLYLENTSNPYLVAPNTNFHLNLDLNKTKAEPGNYRVDVTAKDSKNHTWKFTQNFTVKKEAADTVNKRSILPKEKNDSWIVILLAVLLIAALAVIIYLLLKRRKKEE